MDQYLSLKQAEDMGFGSKDTLHKRIKRGSLPAVIVEKGKQKEYQVLLSDLTGHKVCTWQQYYTEWVDGQRTGYLAAKPLGQRSIEANEYGMSLFWQKLDVHASVHAFTVENLRLALSRFEVTPETCHYSQREQVFKAFCSFTKLLIEKGLRTEADLVLARKLKPKRVIPAKRAFITEEQLKNLIQINREWTTGRTAYDIRLTEILIVMYAMTGLRLNELLSLRIQDIDTKKGIVQVKDGKGHKPRTSILLADADIYLSEYLKTRPKTKHQNLIVSQTGLVLHDKQVSKRIRSLKEQAAKQKMDIDITAHALRRCYATLLANRGIPVPIIQSLLGHSTIDMTQLYMMSNIMDFLPTIRGQVNEKQPQFKKFI